MCSPPVRDWARAGRELGDSMEPRFRNCFCCVGGHIEAYRSRVVVVGARALLPIRFV